MFNKYKQNTDKAIAYIVLKVTSRLIFSENYGSPSWTEITLRYMFNSYMQKCIPTTPTLLLNLIIYCFILNIALQKKLYSETRSNHLIFC